MARTVSFQPWLLLVLVLVAACASPVRASGASREGTGFVAISLHDVVDTPADLDAEAVTSDRLVGLLEWLSGNGWTAISLDDVERARRGLAPLPPKAVLITVDDGLASLYTRVYPLAMAYRMPVVAALVGDWMDAPDGASIRYGERELPRAAFVTWAQAREMQASGWVEFATHTHALHATVRANPQGSLLPAAQNRIWREGGYEDAEEFRARIRADLAHARARLRAELGREPRALAWPYGRYNADALAVATGLGFDFAMTLEAGPADATRPHAIPRFMPTGDPALATWVDNLRFHDPWPAAQRIVGIDPAQLATGDPVQTDARLGRAIERLVALGATHVMLDAGSIAPDGRLASTWFPNAEVPVRADVLGRFAAQMRARAGVEVVVRLPHASALRRLGDAQRVPALYRDLAAHVPFSGLVLEDVPSLAMVPVQTGDAPWDVADRRAGMSYEAWPQPDLVAARAFEAATAGRPGLRAYWLAPRSHPLDRPSGLVEVTLVPSPPRGLGGGTLPSTLARRSGAWLDLGGGAPPARMLARAAHTFLVGGGTIIGWGPDDALADPADAQALAPVVSARRLPPPGTGAP